MRLSALRALIPIVLPAQRPPSLLNLFIVNNCQRDYVSNSSNTDINAWGTSFHNRKIVKGRVISDDPFNWPL